MAAILLIPLILLFPVLYLFLRKAREGLFSFSGDSLYLSMEHEGTSEDIYLENPGLNSFIFDGSGFFSSQLWLSSRLKKTDLALTFIDGRLQVVSKKTMVVSGVSTLRGSLAPGDFLRWSGWKMRYLGRVGGVLSSSSTREISARILNLSLLFFLIPILSGLLSFTLILPGMEQTQPQDTALEAITEEKIPARRDVAISASTDLIQIPPGGAVPAVKVDVLFIHAHPDDESLDYGALLSRLDIEGKSTAVLLLTDGESGIFREGYAGKRENLPEIRLREVEAALKILGCDLFIRFGLPNHPYNGLADVMTHNEVLDSWGGKEPLAARIAEVIQTLNPAIIVSPDGPSASREHFEHESTGIAVAAALDYMKYHGLNLPGSHLLAVDPRQHELYPDALAVSREKVLKRQTEALLSHQTQADAAVFGVEMVHAIRNEYYAVRRWNMEVPPDEYPGL